MRQKTKNHRKQGSSYKKFDFFPQTLSHIPRWVRFVQKTWAKNSHAWAPLSSRWSICRFETLLQIGIPLFTLMRILNRILLVNKVMQSCHYYWSTALFRAPLLYCERPRLSIGYSSTFEPPQLLKFEFDAYSDPYPALDFDSEPEPAFQMMRIRIGNTSKKYSWLIWRYIRSVER